MAEAQNKETKQKSDSNAVDFESCRARYRKLVNFHNKKWPEGGQMTREQYDKVIHCVLQCEQAKLKNSDCSKLKNHKCYPQFEVFWDDNKEMHLIKKRAPDGPVIKYVIAEDTFEVLLLTHTANDHCGSEKLLKIAKQRFDIGSKYADCLVQACNVCQDKHLRKMRKQRLMKSRQKNQNFLVDVFDFKTGHDEKFKFIFYCKETRTNFVYLRPLIDFCHFEVATELFKIILSIGPPETSISTQKESKKFFCKVIRLLRKWGIYQEIHVKSCTIQDNIYSSIRVKISEWMTQTGSNNWELGCHLVQWRLNNNLYHATENITAALLSNKQTPYYLLFGRVNHCVKKYQAGYASKSSESSSESDSDIEELDDDDEAKILTEIVKDLDDDDMQLRPVEKTAVDHIMNLIQHYTTEDDD